jgi:hypothetical protein
MKIAEAAKWLAESFDYPWEYMPEKGKDDFKAKVRHILAAIPPEPVAVPECLKKGAVSMESVTAGGGMSHRVVLSFSSLLDMHEAGNALRDMLAAAPQPEQPAQKFHAPGLGEVHDADHKHDIWCGTYEDGEGNALADDQLAKWVCFALNAYGLQQPAQALTDADIFDVRDSIEITDGMGGDDFDLLFARAIEARLKGANNAG